MTVPILVADRHTVSNAPDLFRPLPQLFVGVGDRQDSPQGAVSFCKGDYGGFAKCWGVQRRERERERERERVWSDLYPSWSLAAIPCVALSSCIPDDQRSPAPPVHTKLLLFAPCKRKAAILLRGNKHVYFLALALWSP